MDPSKSIFVSKTFWTAVIGGILAPWLAEKGFPADPATQDYAIAAGMGLAMVVLRRVSSGPVHVVVPPASSLILPLLLAVSALSVTACLTQAQDQAILGDAKVAESDVATGTYAACTAVSAVKPLVQNPLVALIPEVSQAQSVFTDYLVPLCDNSKRWEASSATWLNRNLAGVLAVVTKAAPAATASVPAKP